MKTLQILFPLLIVLIFFDTILSQANIDSTKKYDKKLAKKLGADEFGMKKYVMAFLKAGKSNLFKEDSEKLFKAHLKNIMRLADEGKLLAAGPFLDEGQIRGIYIFNVETIEEAQKLTETDPAIKAGALVFELHPWYGSAALQELMRIHKTIERKNIAN